jgi:hypothetical protein
MGEPATRTELLALERDRWTALARLLEEVPTSKTTEPSLTPEGWSVRTLVWHLACWNDAVSEQLRKMRLGTFDESVELFSETAHLHVDDHLPELRRFVGEAHVPKE